MIVDMLCRHWVTIFAILLFSIKLWSGKKFRNTENKFFWMTVISCFLLVLEDSFESFSSLYPSMRFFRTLLSVLGYTLRSTAALSLLLVVLPSKKRRFIYCVPSIITFLVCSTAFFTDIAFGFDDNYAFYRGPLGYVAFVVPILYLMMIMWIIFKNFSEKSSLEKYIMPVCAVFCLSSSFLDVVGLEHRVGNVCIIGRFSEKAGKYAVIVKHAVVVKIRTVIHIGSPCEKILYGAKFESLYTKMHCNAYYNMFLNF